MQTQPFRKWGRGSAGVCTAIALASAVISLAAWAVCAVDAAGITAPTSAVSAEAKPAPQQIQQWITQLTSHRYSIRHAAAKKLSAAGDAAVPAMKKALSGLTTPEMRHLLRQGLREIAHADLLRGPLITLDAKDISAQQAFDSVCRQAGTVPNFINSNPGMMPRVSIHAHNVPFWQVMQKLAVLTGISPAPGYYGNPQQLTLIPNGSLGKGHSIDIEGGFAITPQSVTYNRSVSFMSTGPSATQTFNIQAALLSIPGKTGPMQVQQTVVTKAVDNHGNSLVTPTPGNMWYGGNQMGGVASFNIPLQWPHNPGTVIKVLRGYIPVIISSHKKMLDLKFKAKGVASASIDGIKVSISHRTGKTGMWHFTYRIMEPAGAYNPNSNRQNIINQLDQLNSATIITAAGRTVQTNGWGGGGGGPQGITYNVNVMGGKPAEFRMAVFTRQQSLRIPLNLKNIPMP